MTITWPRAVLIALLLWGIAIFGDAIIGCVRAEARPNTACPDRAKEIEGPKKCLKGSRCLCKPKDR